MSRDLAASGSLLAALLVNRLLALRQIAPEDDAHEHHDRPSEPRDHRPGQFLAEAECHHEVEYWLPHYPGEEAESVPHEPESGEHCLSSHVDLTLRVLRVVNATERVIVYTSVEFFRRLCRGGTEHRR